MTIENAPVNPMLEQALELARLGFWVFPIKAGEKQPPLVKFKDEATRDEGQIRRWWAGQEHNVGLFTGRFGDSQALVVVDVDVKNDKRGDSEILRLELEGKDFPETYTQFTPTGGRHLVYRVSSALKQGANVLGPGLDIRSRGGFIVGAGSVIKGVPYMGSRSTVANAPEWLVQSCASVRPTAHTDVAPDNVPAERARARAIEYLKSAPLAVEGNGGDATTFAVCAGVRDFGVVENEALDLLLTHWNDRCSPPWNDDDLLLKVRNAYKYAQNEPGVRSPESVFSKHPYYKPAPDPTEAGLAPAGGPEDGALPDLPAVTRRRNSRIEGTLPNVVAVLQRPDVCGVRLALDTFKDEIMVARAGTEDWVPLTDGVQAELRHRIEDRIGFDQVRTTNMREGLLIVAERLRFDSGQVWLDSVAWDGKPRVETFVPTYFGAADTEYTRAVGLYLWSALAGRIIEPGVKADMAPVLVSPQGWRKSAGIAAMVPSEEFFRELSLDAKDDNLARQIRGKVVCELAELNGMNRADVEWLKTWMTRRWEEWIRKYEERAHRYPRRCIFIGTSNRDDFLIDDTGNRRWLPFKLERMVDVDAIARDREQLWAEGAVLFKAHGVLFRRAEELAREEHIAFEYHDTWQESIEEWLNQPLIRHNGQPTGITNRERPHFTLRDVLLGLGIGNEKATRPVEVRVANALRKLGYEKAEVRIDGKKVRGWRRPSSVVL